MTTYILAAITATLLTLTLLTALAVAICKVLAGADDPTDDDAQAVVEQATAGQPVTVPRYRQVHVGCFDRWHDGDYVDCDCVAELRRTV